MSWQLEVPCRCRREELARIALSLPAGLRLQATCDLRYYNGQFIDLRQSTVDMNQYRKDRNGVNEVFYLSGTFVVSGEIRVEPNDSGTLFFIPRRASTISRLQGVARRHGFRWDLSCPCFGS